MHGLGNDYIVVEWVELAREIGRKNSEILECKFPQKHPKAEQELRDWIQHVCDRHFGIGADGVLIICPSQTADFRMLIYNADGSRAKMCGNGIRCSAKYMWDSGCFKQKNHKLFHKSGSDICINENNSNKSGNDICTNGNNSNRSGTMHSRYLKIDTDSGVKIVKNRTISRIKNIVPNITKPAVAEIMVNMGKPSTDYKHLNIDYEGCSYTIIPVSMGNLHAVVFLDAEEALWETTEKYDRLATYIQNLDYFSDGVNVEFAQILDSNHIQMRVWERGVGETLACGTGACAVCVAAIKVSMEKTLKSDSDINTDLTKKHRQYILIKLKGGMLKVSWTPGEDVCMTGPAVTVFEGNM